ncbi:putative F-box protein At1g46840 [Prosopis cineraria]|uniref:putative F-box protein At1g46840 n=1 Tax=Prosopis cineraria TaxID=364024 RepID=UPI00240FFAE5|nr:putative F-box protein At1g46840 [Prosopis cineraria]
MAQDGETLYLPEEIITNILKRLPMRVLQFQNVPWKAEFRVVGSCNGLLCIRLFDLSCLLWNPATREVISIPKPLNFFGRVDLICDGFGFHPIVNDYRIVRLHACQFDGVYGVQVFSVSTGSWKEVKSGNLKGVRICTSDGFRFNGAIFWLGTKNDCRLIVSFDIVMEVFTLIPMPTPNSKYGTSFIVYENKLAILYPPLTGPPLIELWVMEESTGSSWTKRYTYCSPYSSCLLIPMAFWRNGIVCYIGKVENDSAKTVLINPTTNEFQMIDLCRPDHSHFVFDYAESLVSISNIHAEEQSPQS